MLFQILYIGFHEYLPYFTNSCFHTFEQVTAIWKSYQKLKKIDDLIHFSNVLLGKVLILKNIFQVTMNKWFKNKWNVVQYKVISVILINGKKRFRFYIFCCLKIWQKFEKKVCLLRGRRGGNISWQTQLRSSNVIYQQTLNRLYQPRWNTNQK